MRHLPPAAPVLRDIRRLDLDPAQMGMPVQREHGVPAIPLAGKRNWAMASRVIAPTANAFSTACRNCGNRMIFQQPQHLDILPGAFAVAFGFQPAP